MLRVPAATIAPIALVTMAVQSEHPCWWYEEPPPDCIDTQEYATGSTDPGEAAAWPYPNGFGTYGSYKGHTGFGYMVKWLTSNNYYGTFVGSGGCEATIMVSLTYVEATLISWGFATTLDHWHVMSDNGLCG